MPNPYSSFDYSPQFVFQGSGFAANSVNSSHLINGTIIGSDIATGTITNANFVDGTITPEKLSSVLVAKLQDFETRITALENTAPSVGWSGNIVFTRSQGGGSNIVIYLKTDAGFIANAATYPANNTFAVSLPTPESYLYVKVESGGGGWEVGTQNFTQNVGEPNFAFENNVVWYKYVIGEYAGSQLDYDFTTYYDD
jgi:hypothetical protein